MKKKKKTKRFIKKAEQREWKTSQAVAQWSARGRRERSRCNKYPLRKLTLSIPFCVYARAACYRLFFVVVVVYSRDEFSFSRSEGDKNLFGLYIYRRATALRRLGGRLKPTTADDDYGFVFFALCMTKEELCARASSRVGLENLRCWDSDWSTALLHRPLKIWF